MGYQSDGKFSRSTADTRNSPRSARTALSAFDPADRFLAATAEILNLTLVTADHRLLGLGKISTLANR